MNLAVCVLHLVVAVSKHSCYFNDCHVDCCCNLYGDWLSRWLPHLLCSLVCVCGSVRVLECMQADLIHLGAKYSPCMRRDENVMNAIMQDRQKENKTGCCVRSDGSGCVQTQRRDCPVSS